jgi:hypothetical protein
MGAFFDQYLSADVAEEAACRARRGSCVFQTPPQPGRHAYFSRAERGCLACQEWVVLRFQEVPRVCGPTDDVVRPQSTVLS